MRRFWSLWERIAHLRCIPRFAVKLGVFTIVLFFMLNPRPGLFVKQLPRYLDMEALIQTDFPALKQINQEIDVMVPPNASPKEEFSAVQRYVYQHIPYEYDWDNWGNIDFWPTAEQVWERRQEDCDGRAVLAASILRSHGFPSAKLVGNIRHIWVHVDQGELMGPDTEKNIRHEDGKLVVTLPSLRVILGSTAIYIADFPTVRNLFLFFIALGLCFHPCKNLIRFLGATTVGLVGFILLKDWAMDIRTQQISGVNIYFIAGCGLLCLSMLYALFANTMIKRKIRFLGLSRAIQKQGH